jgi:hypothetical protein
MRITNHSLISPLIPTNHTSPTRAPALCVNMGSQPYTFPNPLNHAQLGHFSLFILFVPIVGHDHTPILPPFLQHALNLHLKFCAPPMGVILQIEG